MDIKCSFFAIVGGHCGHDTRVKNKSSECVQLLSCNHDITGHKSSLGLIDIESKVDLILARASMFTAPENIEQFVICPAHRSTLGTGWKMCLFLPVAIFSFVYIFIRNLNPKMPLKIKRHPLLVTHSQRRRNIDNWGGGGRYSYIRVQRL